MPAFRLYNVDTAGLETHELDSHPPYIAASHVWNENVFTRDKAHFATSFGGEGMKAVIERILPNIKHCWFDTVCIDQQSEDDKKIQIPLMDKIYGEAEVVLVFISHPLQATQAEVDYLTNELQGAVDMCTEESWTEAGSCWQYGEGRRWIRLGMSGLLRLAGTQWATRVWTLQEYVLAKSIIWIGTDMTPIRFDDRLISTLPDICNSLAIDECLGSTYRILYSHFQGMANAKLGGIDRTRVMELVGNRNATVPADEVYGAMAASGVMIAVQKREPAFVAWRRWWAESIRQGNIRWLLLPASSGPWANGEAQNCTCPCFAQRHLLSSSACLDKVKALGPAQVTDGSVTAFAKVVGHVRLIRWLGRVHESVSGRIDRDITLVIFAKGKFFLALQLVSTFGGGRYNLRRAIAISRVMIRSYHRAVNAIQKHQENKFRPRFLTKFEAASWNDLIALQESQMIGLNEGFGNLVEITVSSNTSQKVLGVLVTSRRITPNAMLTALDFDAKAPDGRLICMVVQQAQLANGDPILHKVGMTLPISDEDARSWFSNQLATVRIGGATCSICSETAPADTDRVRDTCEQPLGQRRKLSALPAVPRSWIAKRRRRRRITIVQR